MLKQKYILFVYLLIISKIHLQTQYALMFTFFLANYYLKQNKTKHTNKHTYTLIHADKKSVLD